MRRELIGGVLVAVSLVSASAAASGGPVLRSAAPESRYIVVTFSTGDLIPGRIQVATSPMTGPTGAFMAGSVRLREAISSQSPVIGAARWKTHALLPRGTYYVEVSGSSPAA